ALLKQAEAGRVGVAAGAAQEAERKRKLAEYQKWMDTGRVALRAGQTEQALAAFRAALTVVPGDPAATASVRDVEAVQAKGRGERLAAERKRQEEQAREQERARAAAEAERRRADEEAKRQAAFNQLLAQGQGALGQKNYAAAAQSFRAALQVRPNDP